jgi:putative sterol carrier protein
LKQTIQISAFEEQHTLKDTEEYASRTFVTGDEAEIVNLFNSTHADLAGFVPRTPDYWKWCCLTRPSVYAEGIVIVTRQDETVGYAVVGKTGDIWELGYNPNYNSKAIVKKLLIWATNYAKNVGSDSLVLNEFAKNETVREVCRELDFVETQPEQVFLSVMDLPGLISEILQSKKTMLNTEGTFLFKLTNCPSWSKDSFVIKTEKTGFSLSNETDGDPEVTVKIDVATFAALIFGDENLRKAILTSKIRVQPFWKIQKCLKLLSLLKIESQWSIPKADIG